MSRFNARSGRGVGRRQLRRAEQLELRPRTWGGKRKGAGRKKSGHGGVPHRARKVFAKTTPVHVTLKVLPHVYNLRSQRAFSVVQNALSDGADRFEVRVVRFTVQGNHLHLLVEAPNPRALSSAIRGLTIRLARGLNRMMGTAGRVFAERYHARLVRTPTEVRGVIDYLRTNARKHALRRDEKFQVGWVDPFSSDSQVLRIRLPEPQTWLVKEGWRLGKPAKDWMSRK